jgi:hypothetical protein
MDQSQKDPDISHLDEILRSHFDLLFADSSNQIIEIKTRIQKDYENRYLVLKGMILNGNDNIDIKNELNLF